MIFDFNGVIVDDEHLHFQSFAETLARRGLRLTRDEYVRDYLGLDDRDFFSEAIQDKEGRVPGPAALSGLVEEKAGVYAGKMGGEVPFFPGVKPLVRALADEFPLGLYSGARQGEIETLLRREGLAGCFSAVVSADDVNRGKPDPEGYLLAWRRIRDRAPGCADLTPAQCLVIEDAPAGVAAAQAAGMACLALTHTRPRQELTAADHVADTLQGKSPAWFRQLKQAPEHAEGCGP